MTDLAFADTAAPDLDDIGYEWRREQLLESGPGAEITPARGGRP